VDNDRFATIGMAEAREAGRIHRVRKCNGEGSITCSISHTTMSVGRTGSRSSVCIYPQIRFSLYKNFTLWPEHPREESPLCLALGRKFDSKAPRLYRLAPFEGKPARAVGGEGDGR
jgi:hypothetical protein